MKGTSMLEQLRTFRPRVLALAATLALCAQTALAAPIWSAATLPGNGVVAGAAGSTVGWGYEIVNPEAALWLVLTGVSADVFEHGTPLALFDLPVIAPAASVSTPFDGVAGLYGLAWDADAPEGFSNLGNFVLTAEWWDGDPFAGGRLVEQADALSLAYSATVGPRQGPGEVPAPSVPVLLLVGGAAWLMARRVAPGAVQTSTVCHALSAR